MVRCHSGIVFSFVFLRLSVALPTTSYETDSEAGQLDERDVTPLRGIQILENTCTNAELSAVENAILDASYLAGAGINAAENFTQLPFKFFFPGDPSTANWVVEIYHRVLKAQQGDGPLIFVGCHDIDNGCNASNNPYGYPGYTMQFLTQHKSPHIIMCPLGLAMNRNPLPCTRSPGGIFLGWLILRLMIHHRVIFGSGLPLDDRKSATAAEVGAMVAKGQNTVQHVNAYAFLGSWSWDMGLGGPPWNQHHKCLDLFSEGSFDASLKPFRDYFG